MDKTKQSILLRRKEIRLGWLLIAAFSLFLLSGCSFTVSSAPGEIIDPVPQTGYTELVLYFSDDQAMEVWPEFRKVEVPSDPAQRLPEAELVVLELLKGPQDDLLRKTLPPEAKLLSLTITDGVAFVNFSKELQSKHWGGSAGEGMTLASLVTSLTNLPEIDSVQILVEGKTVETLAGHYDLSQPSESFGFVRAGEVFCSEERTTGLQKRVGVGEELWRKDPLEVSKREAGVRRLLSDFTFELVSIEENVAKVNANGQEDYQIVLIQPEVKGENGIWIISEVKAR